MGIDKGKCIIINLIRENFLVIEFVNISLFMVYKKYY